MLKIDHKRPVIFADEICIMCNWPPHQFPYTSSSGLLRCCCCRRRPRCRRRRLWTLCLDNLPRSRSSPSPPASGGQNGNGRNSRLTRRRPVPLSEPKNHSSQALDWSTSYQAGSSRYANRFCLTLPSLTHCFFKVHSQVKARVRKTKTRHRAFGTTDLLQLPISRKSSHRSRLRMSMILKPRVAAVPQASFLRVLLHADHARLM